MRFTPLFLAGLVSIGAVVPSFAAAEELDSRGNTQYEIDIISPGNAFRSTDSAGEIALKSGAGKKLVYTIDDASASHEKTFDFNLPPEGEIVTEDGFFYVAFDGVKKIRFSVPWAIDAEGNSLNTWFTTDGKRLTQHVQFDENTAFPVKADPRMNWGIVSGHVYFDKEETKKAGATAAGAFAVSPFWVLVPPPFGEAIGIWWQSHSAEVAAWAAAASAQDKCLALKIGVTGKVALNNISVGVTPEHYTEGCN